MGVRKDIDGSASVPEMYGAELRWKREAAKLTLKQTVEGSFYSANYLSEIELGNRRMPPELARHIDRLLVTDGFFERRSEDARKARKGGHADYFETVAESEVYAQTIEEWHPSLFPGLLQTEAYMRTLIRAALPLERPEDLDEKVNSRLGRQRLFEAPDQPELWVILHEDVVRRSILPPAEMAELLDRILGLVEQRRLTPQIMPWNLSSSPFMEMHLRVMDFSDAPPFVYTEGTFHGETIDLPNIVGKYRKAYDRLRAAALSPEASLDMIHALAEDYRNGKPPK